jgi:iron complex outermembrane receptor protein
MNLHKKPVAAAVAAILAIRPAADVLADDAATAQLEEIVVTSTRRSTSVQETPISITAVSGETVQHLGMQTLDQMATLVPGLNLINSGPWGNSTIIMRGLNANSINGTGNDTTGGGTVGVYLGETPLYADFKLLDINRVESLMGPQGTLYGAGTLAGAIRYVPNRPDLANFSSDVGGRAYELKEGSGAGHEEQATLNVPLITGMLGIRGTFANYYDPGFIDYPDIVRIPGFGNPQPDFNNPVVRDANLVREKDLNYEKTFSTRISTLFTPFSYLEGLLTYAHQNTNTGGRQLQSTDAIGTGPYEAGFRYAEPSERRADLVGIEVTAKLFGIADLVGSSSYTRQTVDTVRDQTDLLLYLSDTGGYGYEDFPQFIAYTTGATTRRQHTNEIRLVSNDQGRFTWIVGYFKNTLTSNSLGIEYTPGLPKFFGIDRPDQMEYYSSTDLSQTEKATYGELGFKITSAWQVTAGGRHYKYDVFQRNLTDLPLLNKGPYEFSPKERKGTTGASGSLYKFNTSYKISATIMAYATVSQGYRLGGFNPVAPCPEGVLTGQNVCALPREQQFLPDKTLNKEIGLRTQWFDHRLTVNADVYYIDWKDVQVNGITQNGAVGITTNGARAVSKGVEWSLQGALPYGFGVTANYTYTNAKLTQAVKGLVDDRYTLTGVTPGAGDAQAGDRLPGSPEHKGAVYASWSHGLPNDAVFRADYGVALQSNVFTKVGDRASGEALGGFATHQLAFSVEKDNWMVGLYGENIWNKYAATAVTNDKSFNYTVLGGTAADPTAFAVRRYARTIIRPREIGLQFRMKFGQP